MTVEIIISGASLVVAGVASWGVVMTWRRNGHAAAARDEENAKAQAVRDERIAASQENIVKQLADPNEGLSAINRKVNGMVNHCATVSTGLTERVRAAERDISELKQK